MTLLMALESFPPWAPSVEVHWHMPEHVEHVAVLDNKLQSDIGMQVR